MIRKTDQQIIILFDGVCNLCNGAVQFVIKRDRAALFRFASLQSEAGRTLMSTHGLDPDSLNSIVVVENEILYQRSDAVLKIAARLPFPWSWMTVLRAVPRFLRDPLYNMVAKSRYSLFGRRDQCMIPTPELRDRFLSP